MKSRPDYRPHFPNPVRDEPDGEPDIFAPFMGAHADTVPPELRRDLYRLLRQGFALGADRGPGFVATQALRMFLPTKRSGDILAAWFFGRVLETRGWWTEGYATLGEFAEQNGYSASEGWMLARAGVALKHSVAVRVPLLEGKLSLEAVSILARVITQPELRGGEPLETWIRWAQEESARKLRARVRTKMEEARVGGPVHEVTLPLSSVAVEKFDRSLTLLSEKNKRPVGDSEGLEMLADYFLDREDPDRVEPGKRRVGDTVKNRSRYIPEEVKRKVRARSRGFCEVPGCDKDRFLNFCHIQWHATRGSRETTNIVHGCHSHHAQMDMVKTLQARVVLDEQGNEVVQFRRGVYSNGGLKYERWPPRPTRGP